MNKIFAALLVTGFAAVVFATEPATREEAVHPADAASAVEADI